jgi:hypothetical protein
MGWIVVGAWVFAALLAVVVLGFAAYELRWKTQRLLADRDKLNAVATKLGAVSADLQRTADRAKRASTEVRAARSSGPSAS